MCVCVCVCVGIYIYIPTYIYITYIHTYVRTYLFDSLETIHGCASTCAVPRQIKKLKKVSALVDTYDITLSRTFENVLLCLLYEVTLYK